MFKKLWLKLMGLLNKKQEKPEENDPVKTEPHDDAESAHGFTHSAKVVAEIDLHHINKSGIYFSAQKRKWKVVDGCDGEVHLFVMRDGAWRGYKFDHIRPTSTSRDWKNLNPENPYGHWKQLGAPKSGEPIAMIAISYDHKERTNAIFAQYP
jgi:hypothetical protein